MNTITENDIIKIKQQIVKRLTGQIDSSGAGNLAKQIVEISATVASEILWEYHKLISDQSS